MRPVEPLYQNDNNTEEREITGQSQTHMQKILSKNISKLNTGICRKGNNTLQPTWVYFRNTKVV